MTPSNCRGRRILGRKWGSNRMIYEIEGGVLLLIVLVGKRNDGDVYRKMSRKAY